jgi:hypothetical protein
LLQAPSGQLRPQNPQLCGSLSKLSHRPSALQSPETRLARAAFLTAGRPATTVAVLFAALADVAALGGGIESAGHPKRSADDAPEQEP